MVDIEFQTPEDGWEVGGDQCGGQFVTACPGVAMHTTDGGASWTVSTASLKYPFGWQIACQGETCLLDAQGKAFFGDRHDDEQRRDVQPDAERADRDQRPRVHTGPRALHRGGRPKATCPHC